jgi:hypothetical protein
MRQSLTAFAVAVCLLAGVAGNQQARSNGESWREIAWPYPRDAWPAGRAFRCASELCGDETEVYLRPKIGFCNCDSGVADDDEVDRVADLDLISERFDPLEPGKPIRIAGMPGRLRAYQLSMPDGSRRSAVGIAVSHRCDLLVAVAQGNGAVSAVERVALEFLGLDAMTRWMTSAMGGS